MRIDSQIELNGFSRSILNGSFQQPRKFSQPWSNIPTTHTRTNPVPPIATARRKTMSPQSYLYRRRNNVLALSLGIAMLALSALLAGL